MKEYIYSASNNSFFKISDLYLYERWNLADGVEVEESIFNEFTQDLSAAGLVRVAGNDGLPAWGIIPPPSQEEQIVAAEHQRTALLAEASAVIAPLADAQAGGYIDDTDVPRLAEWQRYRYKLTKVDTSTAPGITFPPKPVT